MSMKSGYVLLMLFFLTGAAFVAGAQEQGGDPENVPTPLTLSELLPPGGVDAVDIDFWIRTDASYDGRPMDIRFMHWSIQPADDNLVVIYDDGKKRGELLEHRRARTTYSKAGKILDYYQISHRNGKKVNEIRGKAEGNELVLKSTDYDINTGREKSSKTTRSSLEPLKTSTPSGWFPLIVAYHIRKGSLSYSFSRTDLHYNFQHAETSIQDVGTELLEYEGKQVKARLLLGERNFGKNNRPDRVDSKLQYHALPNGELMYIRNLYNGYKFLGYRKTREQIAEEFWLIPEEGEAGDREAGGDAE